MKCGVLALGVALVAVGATAQTHDPRYADRLYPDLIVHPDRVSGSGWLWNSAGPVADGAESFFRLRFSLPDEVRSASLRAWFDDGGALFVNGVRLAYVSDTSSADPAALVRQLRRGENVLAVRVKNGTGPGGVIFLLEAELANGERLAFHSDEKVKSSPVAADGWEKPDFDDAAWGGSTYQADAKGAPWSRAQWAQKGVLERFMTAAEVARYEQEDRVALTVPAGIDFGPAPDARIVYVNNLPKISLNGRLYDPQWKMAGAADEWEASSFRRLGKLGIEFVMANVGSAQFETAPGQYDFSCFEREAVGALRANPNAKIMFGPRLNLEKWLEANPTEAIAYAAGPVRRGSNEHRGRPFRPSAASRAYRRAACDCLAQLAAWIKTRPWANRVVMIRPCWGIYQEWHTFGMWDGPDVSQPMTAAFRRYGNGRWADAEPPTMAERTTGGFMYDPVRDAKCIDFFLCQQEEVADLAAAFARTIKTHLPGRLVGMWYGYVFTAQAPEGANVLLDRMLANPDIDYLCDIATYQPASRQAGGAYMHRTIPATFRRYGKMCVLEDDNRYDWLAGLDREHAAIYMRSPQESVATAERNYLSRLFDRCGIQYTDPIRGHGLRPFIIDNDVVLRGIANAQRVFRTLESRVPADSGLDTAIVVDYRERFYWDGQTGKTRTCPTGFDLYEHSPIALYRAGTDFDVLSLDDYLATPKRYARVVAFNLFHTPEAQRTAFVEKAARDAAAVAQIVVPGSPSADLGKGVAVLDRIPVTGAAWAEVFRRLGTHLYTAPGNCFRRNGELMMFCTADAGRHVISLPPDRTGGRYRDYLGGGTYAAPDLTLVCDGPTTFLLAPEATGER